MFATYVFCLLFTGMEGDSILKQDLKAIRELQREKRAVELVKVLNLSPDQVTMLKAVKAEVDRLKQDRETLRKQLEQTYGGTIHQVRQTLESGEEPDTASLDQLKAFKRETHMQKKTFRLKMQLAVMPLEDFLNDEQKASIKALSKDAIKKRAGKGKFGRRQAGQNQKHRMIQKAKRHWARVLLSDAFIQAL